MKKQIIALSFALMSIGVFAQKNELKAAEKAIKKEQYADALTAITAAEALMGNMDAKSTAKFYFLKAQGLCMDKKDTRAADAFEQLFAYER